MNRIKVLIVDDAVVVRKLITDALSGDPEIEIVGTAPNGRIGLQKIAQLKPDVVTMDIEMPEMDGLTTVSEIRKVNSRLPVIMFSTLTERGGQATLEALARGATDYVTKPSNVGSVREGIERCREELIPKIKWLAGSRSIGRPSLPTRTVTATTTPVAAPARPLFPNAASAVPVPRTKAFVEGRANLIVIGVSTGGPVALSKVLPLLPKELPVPVLVVQHMPPVFTRLLAERLDVTCQLRVVEGKAGMPVEAGKIYIAPGGSHMVVKRAGERSFSLDLNQDAPENSCRPAVDVLFRSAVQACGGQLVAAVLTGMGSDGMRGAELVRAAGGYVLAQDQASSVVWGMPGSVVSAGLADDVVPLDRVAMTLARKVRPGLQMSEDPASSKPSLLRPATAGGTSGTLSVA